MPVQALVSIHVPKPEEVVQAVFSRGFENPKTLAVNTLRAFIFNRYFSID